MLRRSLHNSSTQINIGYTCSRNSFHSNHLRSTEFNSLQELSESGSGPGGRRFKSSLPDQSFQGLTLHFWFSVYIAGVEIVDGACILIYFRISSESHKL